MITFEATGQPGVFKVNGMGQGTLLSERSQTRSKL
jgi:hypothetical protein